MQTLISPEEQDERMNKRDGDMYSTVQSHAKSPFSWLFIYFSSFEAKNKPQPVSAAEAEAAPPM